jgi:hypothetical protein
VTDENIRYIEFGVSEKKIRRINSEEMRRKRGKISESGVLLACS